ncbi:alpha/beta fold hydrolase [Maribacter sp. 2210JD10-5]|uniref:alpha/beta fold hydrolase n=1 Tax=Maribacter sp. 2210JD10-5 TaxID=3386272 RepID=UPI0039BCF4D4
MKTSEQAGLSNQLKVIHSLRKAIHIKNTALGKIEYSIQGNGQPILFLHGGHSNCKEFLIHKGFDPKDFCLITPSRPGYGNTPLKDNCTPKRAADLMIALLDELQLDRVVVYAVSAAGPTAIALAANYPERVLKLVLASAVTKKWLSKNELTYKMAQWLFHPNLQGMTWGMIRFFSRLMPNTIAKSFYQQFTKNKAHKISKDEVSELLATLRHYRSQKGFLCDIDHIIESVVLSEIKAPTLIIHSENDKSVSFDHALHAHRMIGNARLIKLNNEWGHLIWIGQDSRNSIKETIDFIKTIAQDRFNK